MDGCVCLPALRRDRWRLEEGDCPSSSLSPAFLTLGLGELIGLNEESVVRESWGAHRGDNTLPTHPVPCVSGSSVI